MTYKYEPIESPYPESCYFHPGVPAWVACSRCGKPTCAQCTYVVDVGQRCPECISRREIRPPTVSRARAFLPRPAAATPALIGICVAVFLIDSLTGRRISNFGMSQPFLIYGMGEWWRIGTAIFLHAGLLHLIFNMYALYIVGSILEEAWGAAKLTTAFLVTGVFASLVSATIPTLTKTAVDLARSPGSVGASGAIFGLFGALGVALYRRRHSPWARANLTQIAVIVAINLFIGFAVPGIDNLAHLGGLVAGVVVGAGFDTSAQRGTSGPMIVSLAVVIAAAATLVIAGRLAILA
jgi:membrane associated rhomboid family serine protease